MRKTHRWQWVFVVYMFMFIGFTGMAWGQTHQKGVIGFGFGAHSFSTQDEVRQKFFFSEPTTAGMVELFGEWYPIERVGIGFRSINIGVSETVYFFNAEILTEYGINASLLTAQVLPFISGDGYFRVGLIGGLGGSEASVKQSIGNLSAESTTDGSASLVGVFLDWGGDVFGAHWLNTDLDPLDNGVGVLYEVDGSGSSIYLDLRWAFS